MYPVKKSPSMLALVITITIIAQETSDFQRGFWRVLRRRFVGATNTSFVV